MEDPLGPFCIGVFPGNPVRWCLQLNARKP